MFLSPTVRARSRGAALYGEPRRQHMHAALSIRSGPVPHAGSPSPRPTPPRRRRLAVLLIVVLVGALQLAVAPRAGADAPDLVSRNGITVTATRWISGRTL